MWHRSCGRRLRNLCIGENKIDSHEMQMKRHLTLTILGCATLVAAGVNANTFDTPSGSTVGDGPVNAEATFTTDANKLTIVLTDLLVNPTSVGQLISDISFGFTRTTISSSGISLTSETGAGVIVNGDGSTTTGMPAGCAGGGLDGVGWFPYHGSRRWTAQGTHHRAWSVH